MGCRVRGWVVGWVGWWVRLCGTGWASLTPPPPQHTRTGFSFFCDGSRHAALSHVVRLLTDCLCSAHWAVCLVSERGEGERVREWGGGVPG